MGLARFETAMKFCIRDLLLVTVIVAVVAGPEGRAYGSPGR